MPDDLVVATLSSRKAELQRRVLALPTELNDWQERAKAPGALDMNVHFSQLRAIRILIDLFIDRQKSLLEGLDAQGEPSEFLDKASELGDQIIRSQFVWGFFRNKLQLRFDPAYKDSLWTADTIAWDCYRPSLDHAADLNIVSRDKLREPPLCYYTAEFSAATWVRGNAPDDLRDRGKGTYRTPIPLIEIPWDHAQNPWEFLALAHEVGHDIEADLGLREPLVASLESELRQAEVPGSRVSIWKDWQAEILADLIGLQLVGPAYAEMLMHLLLLPSKQVTSYDLNDPHPTHYVRILLNAASIRTLISGDNAVSTRQAEVLDKHARQIEDSWKAVYGQVPDLQPFVADFPIVARALMETKLPILKNNSLRDLLPYTAADDLRIRQATGYLRTGQDPPSKLRPRHIAAAARLAVSEATALGGDLAEVFRRINENTTNLVRSNGPRVFVAPTILPGHRAFIQSFVDKIGVKAT